MLTNADGNREAEAVIARLVEQGYANYRNELQGFAQRNAAVAAEAETCLNRLYQWDIWYYGLESVSQSLAGAQPTPLLQRVRQIRLELQQAIAQWTQFFNTARAAAAAWQPLPAPWPVPIPAAFSPPVANPVTQVIEDRSRMQDYLNRLRDYAQKGVPYPLAQAMARTETGYTR